jgi:uncharacterized protein (TIGR03000 family)
VFASEATAQRVAGGAVRGGVRGAAVGGLVGGESGAQTGAKVGVVAGAARGVAQRADARAMNAEAQTRAQYETTDAYQNAQRSNFNQAAPDVLATESSITGSVSQGGEATVKKDGKPVVGITYPSDWKQSVGDNYVSAVSADGQAYSVLATLGDLKDKQAGIDKVKQGLEKFVKDIQYDDLTKTDAGSLVITGTGKGKKSGVDVVFAAGVLDAGSGQLVGAAFVVDKGVEDHYKETVRYICHTIRRTQDLGYGNQNSGFFGGQYGQVSGDYSPEMYGPDRVLVRLMLPNPSARVWFDGSPTEQQGSDRLYISPPIDPNKNYTYTIKASWMENGKEVTKEQKLSVRANQQAMASFDSRFQDNRNQGQSQRPLPNTSTARGEEPFGRPEMQEQARNMVVVRIQELHLTNEQETKVADIRNEYRPKVQEAAKDLAVVVKEEEQKVLGILTPEQKTKLQESREELKKMRAESLAEEVAHLGEMQLTDGEIAQIGDIRKEFRPKIEGAVNELEGLLTDDQKKARQAALGSGKRGQEVQEALNLTGEAKEKVQAACKKIGTLFREEVEKIRDTLSAAQNEKLPDLKGETKEHVRDRMAHRVANLKELNLTEEQKTQLADIRKEFRPKVHEVGNKLRGIIKEELEAIAAVLKS